MWALENGTPFCADRAFLRDREGAEVWVVAVRGTFDIAADGRTHISEHQEPVRLAPEFRGEPASSSLVNECDLVVHKPTTDILLLGSAHAPGEEPVTELQVGMAVGPVRKTLRVIGPCAWADHGAGPGLTAPTPFTTAELTYEQSWGGAGEMRNPAGLGAAASPREFLGKPAPRVSYPGGDPKRPAGFGPIPCHWSPRRELGGSHDEAWRRERFPLPPADQDPRFFLCSPEDQRPPGPLQGGEPVSLYNLNPRGTLSFALPRIKLSLVTDFGDRQMEHGATLYTVILEPDYPRVQMVWHSALACHPLVHKLRCTTIQCEEAGA